MPSEKLTDRTVPGRLSGGHHAVSDSGLVVRNHDGTDTYDLDIAFVDADGAVAFDRTVVAAPLETVTVETRLERAVYRVEVTFDGDIDSAECLAGSGPNETALVETGNGTVSVVEGLF